MTFQTGIIKHANQDLRFIKIFFIMYPKIFCRISVAKFYNNRFESIQLDAFILLGTKYQWFTLFKEQGFVGLELFSVNISKAPSLKMLQFW